MVGSGASGSGEHGTISQRNQNAQKNLPVLLFGVIKLVSYFYSC